MRGAERLPELEERDVRALVEEAREEARAKARAILRDRFVEAYVEAAEGLGQAAPASQPEPRPAAPSADGDAVYVYCVGESHADALPQDLDGVGGSAVTTIASGGLRAIASRVPREEFGEEPLKRNLNDMDWLEATARAHQEVIDAAYGTGTIVPLRLCTIYANEESVRLMLTTERDRFGEALDLLRERSEWGVKAYADPARLEPMVAAGPPPESANGGGAYFDRKRRERDAREEALQVVDDAVARAHEQLETVAVDAVVNRPQNRELVRYEGEMVLNAAYLVDDERAEEFATVVRALEDELAERGMRLELTGPWPPYNFVPGRAEVIP
jgi:hypothetical protein